MHALLKNPLVDCDLEEAALWYNRRDPDIAQRLIDETQNAIRMAATDPVRFPVCFREYRRIKFAGSVTRYISRSVTAPSEFSRWSTAPGTSNRFCGREVRSKISAARGVILSKYRASLPGIRGV